MVSRLSYSNVVATLALFVALGGTSYAAVKLPKNSVGSTQLRANAVTGAKVKNRSLTVDDLSASAQAKLRGPVGPVGPAGAAGKDGAAGATGATGPAGASGKDGASGLSRALVKTTPTTSPTTTVFHVGSYHFSASPPAGTYVVTADARFLNLNNSATVLSCSIGFTSDTVGQEQRTLFLAQLGAVGETGTLAVTRTITTQAGDHVSFDCSNSGGAGNANYEVHSPQLTLIGVDQVTALP